MKKVFVSYSHQDESWLRRLQVHLRPLERENKIDLWDDTQIKPGSQWREEIRATLESAEVAVLLISADFLASDFIASDELPPLLAAAEERGVVILPVIVSYSRFERMPSLYRFQAVNSPRNPLVSMNRGEQEQLFVEVVYAIEDALRGPEREPVPEPREPAPEPKLDLPEIQNIHGWLAEGVQTLQRQAAAALDLAVVFRDRLRDGSEGPEMVVIPAGVFLMGSPENEEGRYGDERQHPVRIERPFAIGKYAVTVGEFERFVGSTGYRTEAEKGDGSYYWDREAKDWKKDPAVNWRNPRFEQDSAHPVVCVSWNDAVAYTEWLSRQSGGQYRLPTEAKWEYATRAGTWTPFYFGTTISTDQANYEHSRGQTVSVGQLPPNAWGLYDMHGNVWEWTCSEYDEDYGGAERDCVSNNRAGARRVIRGGSWNYRPRGVRSALRGRFAPGGRDSGVGFRLARNLTL